MFRERYDAARHHAVVEATYVAIDEEVETNGRTRRRTRRLADFPRDTQSAWRVGSAKQRLFRVERHAGCVAGTKPVLQERTQ